MKIMLMGGYAFYVWSAYGLAMFIFISTSVAMKRRQKRTRRVLQQWLQQ